MLILAESSVKKTPVRQTLCKANAADLSVCVEFVDLLNQIRIGIMAPEIIRTFGGLSRTIQYTDGIEPTCLYPRRDQVSNENKRRLSALQAAIVAYEARDCSGKEKEYPYKEYYPDPVKLRDLLNKVINVNNERCKRANHHANSALQEHIGRSESRIQNRSTSNARKSKSKE